MAEKIILVEPDARLRGQMASFFSTRGFVVSEAGSVGEALAALSGFKPTVALVNTPLDEDSATVAFAVRQSPQAALVVMGQPAALDEFRMLVGYEVRPQAFLEKPFTAKQLATQVDAALRTVREASTSKEEAREASARLGDEVGALAEALAQLPRRRNTTDAPRAGGRSVAPGAAPEPVVDPSEPVLSAPPGAILPEADDAADSENRFTLMPMTPQAPHDPRGIYGPVTMAELLYNCFRDLYTGRLLLKRGEVWKSVRLMSGRPVQAASNVQSENLGAMLVAAGRISREQNERSIALARDGVGRQGEILVRMGALSREMLRSALRDQIRTRIVSCFKWTDAEYGLGYDPGSGEVEDSELNPLVLIFEGVRAGAPIEPLVRRFDGAVRRYVATTEKFGDYQPLLRDHPEATEIASLCDGSRVLAEVLGDSPLSLVDTLRVIRALEVMHCITLGDLRPLAQTRVAVGSTPPRWVRPVGASTTGELPRPGWFNAPAGASAEVVPRRVVTSRPAEARPPEPSSAPAARREPASTPPGARPTGDPTRPTGSGFHRSVPRPSTGAPVVRPADTSGSFRAVVRPVAGSQPPERPSVTGMRPTAPRPAPAREPVAPVDAATPAAQLRHEIERIERGENLYEVMGLEPTVALRAVRDQSQRLLRMLNADQVTRLDDTLLDRARLAARRVAEATETLGNRQPRETYDALNLPVRSGAVGVDLLAAESSFNKGQICIQHNLTEKAQRFFAQAVEQDPHQAVYRVFLASANYALAPADDKRARGKALDEARDALESVSGRDDVWMLAADMAQGLGQTELAVRLYNKALDINTGNVRAREALQAIERGEVERKAPDTKSTGLLNKLFSRR